MNLKSKTEKNSDNVISELLQFIELIQRAYGAKLTYETKHKNSAAMRIYTFSRFKNAQIAVRMNKRKASMYFRGTTADGNNFEPLLTSLADVTPVPSPSTSISKHAPFLNSATHKLFLAVPRHGKAEELLRNYLGAEMATTDELTEGDSITSANSNISSMEEHSITKPVTESLSGNVVAASLTGLSSLAEQEMPSLEDDIETAVKSGRREEERQLRAILTRRGQSAFRQEILLAYEGRCAVTGCAVEEVLEAAHIVPHADGTDWKVDNGFALRADIHTLLDRNLMSVAGDFSIHIARELEETEYGQLSGKFIFLPKNAKQHPNREKLAERHTEFLRRYPEYQT